MRYLHEQRIKHSKDVALRHAIVEIGESFSGLCNAGYNPAPLLRSCIELAGIINTPLLREALAGFENNYADYLELLS